MGAWIDELGAAERLKFGSPVLTLEARLRAALAATRGDSDAPDSFRAAAVCECLCRLQSHLFRQSPIAKQPPHFGSCDGEIGGCEAVSGHGPMQ